MGWRDRRAAAKSLRRILAWEFQQIVLSHGDLIDRNARTVALGLVRNTRTVMTYRHGRSAIS